MIRHNITLSEALQGYEIYVEARRLSPHTIRDYFTTFRKLQQFLGHDPPIDDISRHDIQNFLKSFSDIKKKTLLNYHTGLSALWSWLVADGLVEEHIVRQVPPPKPESMEIVPFTEHDIQLMLLACDRSRIYRRNGQYEPSYHALANHLRNRAIIFTLLDTGVRASELCKITIEECDLKNRRISVYGKGAKQRMVPLSAKTGKTIWTYLTSREEKGPKDPVFASRRGYALTKDGLGQLIRRIGKRAGVANAYTHRFRHTFAITYLRNNGDIFTLQRILGHSDLAMVKRYLAIACSDVNEGHRIASPVANWNI